MATYTLPEGDVTLAQRADWFHLNVGAAAERLQMLGSLQDFPEDWADWLFLISDELERQSDAFSSVLRELRALESGSIEGTEASLAV